MIFTGPFNHTNIKQLNVEVIITYNKHLNYEMQQSGMFEYLMESLIPFTAVNFVQLLCFQLRNKTNKNS